MISCADGLVAVMEYSKTRGVKYENAESNAALIASAPQLLINNTRLRGEAKVLRDLLGESLEIILTLEEEADSEWDDLHKLTTAIKAAMGMAP